MDSLGLSLCNIICKVIILIYPCNLNSFYYWPISMAKTSWKWCNGNGDSGYFCPLSVICGKISNFSSLRIKNYGILVGSFYEIKGVPFYFYFIEYFNMKICFVKCHFASTEMIIYSFTFYFINKMYCLD